MACQVSCCGDAVSLETVSYNPAYTTRSLYSAVSDSGDIHLERRSEEGGLYHCDKIIIGPHVSPLFASSAQQGHVIKTTNLQFTRWPMGERDPDNIAIVPFIAMLKLNYVTDS